MAFYDIFRRKQSSAAVAKDRLQIIVARERRGASGGQAGYLPKLQQELLAVIARYETVDLDQVSVRIDRREDGEVLELNILLPDATASVRVKPRVAFA
jgi:cell division topological specificity factor